MNLFVSFLRLFLEHDFLFVQTYQRASILVVEPGVGRPYLNHLSLGQTGRVVWLYTGIARDGRFQNPLQRRITFQRGWSRCSVACSLECIVKSFDPLEDSRELIRRDNVWRKSSLDSGEPMEWPDR